MLRCIRRSNAAILVTHKNPFIMIRNLLISLIILLALGSCKFHIVDGPGMENTDTLTIKDHANTDGVQAGTTINTEP